MFGGLQGQVAFDRKISWSHNESFKAMENKPIQISF
jgi:hypothetical protein